MWDLQDNISTYCLCICFTTPENAFMCYIYHPLSYYFVTVNGTSSNGLFSLAINVISFSLRSLFLEQLKAVFCNCCIVEWIICKMSRCSFRNILAFAICTCFRFILFNDIHASHVSRLCGCEIVILFPDPWNPFICR